METVALTLEEFLADATSVATFVFENAIKVMNTLASNPVTLTFLIVGLIWTVVKIAKSLIRI